MRNPYRLSPAAAAFVRIGMILTSFVSAGVGIWFLTLPAQSTNPDVNTTPLVTAGYALIGIAVFFVLMSVFFVNWAVKKTALKAAEFDEMKHVFDKTKNDK